VPKLLLQALFSDNIFAAQEGVQDTFTQTIRYSQIHEYSELQSETIRLKSVKITTTAVATSLQHYSSMEHKLLQH
jgi:homoserine kinase